MASDRKKKKKVVLRSALLFLAGAESLILPMLAFFVSAQCSGFAAVFSMSCAQQVLFTSGLLTFATFAPGAVLVVEICPVMSQGGHRSEECQTNKQNFSMVPPIHVFSL